jgi:hypothetical protein
VPGSGWRVYILTINPNFVCLVRLMSPLFTFAFGLEGTDSDFCGFISQFG